MRKYMALAALAALLALPIPADAGGGRFSQVGSMRFSDQQHPITQSCVALTFDDGPDAATTPGFLDVLEAKAAAATFFIQGNKINATTSGILQREDKDGFDIGNHTWGHPSLPSLSDAAIIRQFQLTDNAIRKIINRSPDFIRAPYGAMSPRVAADDERIFVGWNVDTNDWQDGYSASYVRNFVLNNAVAGSIILMHDTAGKDVAVLGQIIDGLRQKGFTLVTVSQLLAGVCGGKAGPLE